MNYYAFGLGRESAYVFTEANNIEEASTKIDYPLEVESGTRLSKRLYNYYKNRPSAVFESPDTFVLQVEGGLRHIPEEDFQDETILEGPSSSKVTRDPTREELEDIQDKLFMEHPEKLDTLYGHLRRATGKEPSPALVVNRFKDEYPELYQSVIGR